MALRGVLTPRRGQDTTVVVGRTSGGETTWASTSADAGGLLVGCTEASGVNNTVHFSWLLVVVPEAAKLE